MTTNNESNYLRVRFSKKELADWGIVNADTDSLKNLIKLGLGQKDTPKNSNKLDQKINELENKIDRLALMLGQYCHHSFIANSDKLHEVEKEFHKHKDFHSTPLLRRTGEYLRLSLSIRKELFPELKIPSFLVDTKEKEQALINFYKKFYAETKIKNEEKDDTNSEQDGLILQQ